MSRKIGPRFSPQQFKASIYSPIIIVNHLSTEDKESLWQHLKENYPDKAKSLATVMSDSFVKLIMDKKNGLGALLAIKIEYAPEHLKKHQHIL
jgi:hypothetical protein